MTTSFGARFEKSREELGTGGGGSIWLGRIDSILERQAHREADRMNASSSSRSHPRRRRDLSESASRSPHVSRGDDEADETDDSTQWTLIAVKRKHIQHATSFPSYHNSSGHAQEGRSINRSRDGDDASNPSNEEEHQLLASLGPHPNIITMYGWLTNGTSGATCMALELMDSDLSKELRSGNLPSDLSVRFLTFGVLSALEYLHSRQIVHRDVKPSNLLLKTDQRSSPLGVRVVLSDFGSSHYANDARRPAVNVRGTRWYQPPEILLGKFQPEMACATDIWALGCTVFEMFVGRAPFVGDSCIAMLTLVMNTLCCNFALTHVEGRPMTLFDGVEHRISLEAQEVILMMLTPDPRNRPSADELLAHSYFDPVRDFLCDPTELAATLGPLSAKTRFRCAAEFKLRGGKKIDTSGPFAAVEGASSVAGLVAEGSCSPYLNSFQLNDQSVARSSYHGGMGALQFSSSRASSCATSYRNVHNPQSLGYSSGGHNTGSGYPGRALAYSAQSLRLPSKPLFSNHSPDSSLGDPLQTVHQADGSNIAGTKASANGSIARALHGMYDSSHDTSFVHNNTSQPTSAGNGSNSALRGRVGEGYKNHYQQPNATNHSSNLFALSLQQMSSGVSNDMPNIGRSAGGQYSTLSFSSIGSSRPPTASPLNRSAEGQDVVRCGTSAGLASAVPSRPSTGPLAAKDDVFYSHPPRLDTHVSNKYRNPLETSPMTRSGIPAPLPLPPSSSYMVRSVVKGTLNTSPLPSFGQSPMSGVTYATINASTTSGGLFTLHDTHLASAAFSALVPATHLQRGAYNVINSSTSRASGAGGAVAGVINHHLYDELLTKSPPKALSFGDDQPFSSVSIPRKARPVATSASTTSVAGGTPFQADRNGTRRPFSAGADGLAEEYQIWAGSPESGNPTPQQWKKRRASLGSGHESTQPALHKAHTLAPSDLEHNESAGSKRIGNRLLF